MMIFHCWDFTQ